MTFRLLALPLIALIASAADAPSLSALSSLQPGRWQLSSHDRTFAKRSICLGDPRALLQLRQPTAACSRFVIANQPDTATVHYTCPGSGHGRTTVRVETPGLAQVDTQGFIDNAPFDLSIEARRMGECTSLSMR